MRIGRVGGLQARGDRGGLSGFQIQDEDELEAGRVVAGFGLGKFRRAEKLGGDARLAAGSIHLGYGTIPDPDEGPAWRWVGGARHPAEQGQQHRQQDEAEHPPGGMKRRAHRR